MIDGRVLVRVRNDQAHPDKAEASKSVDRGTKLADDRPISRSRERGIAAAAEHWPASAAVGSIIAAWNPTHVSNAIIAPAL